jgi:hypothetical protein
MLISLISFANFHFQEHGGAKGITSITLLRSWAPTNSMSRPDNLPAFLPDITGNEYYIITAILSKLPDDDSSFISPLINNAPHLKSFHPSPGPFHCSVASSDGRLAAFLTSAGALKLAQLVPSEENGGLGLQMAEIPNITANIAKETDPQNSGRVSIRIDRDGFIVIAVDRYGKFLETRVLTSTVPQDSINLARTTAPALPQHVRNDVVGEQWRQHQSSMSFEPSPVVDRQRHGDEFVPTDSTLSHVNAHATMQSHDQKRTSEGML